MSVKLILCGDLKIHTIESIEKKFPYYGFFKTFPCVLILLLCFVDNEQKLGL